MDNLNSCLLLGDVLVILAACNVIYLNINIYHDF